MSYIVSTLKKIPIENCCQQQSRHSPLKGLVFDKKSSQKIPACDWLMKCIWTVTDCALCIMIHSTDRDVVAASFGSSFEVGEWSIPSIKYSRMWEY